MQDNTATRHQQDNPAESDASRADRWLLRVRGPVDVEITDEQGHRIGRYIESEEIDEERRIARRQEREDREQGRRTEQGQELPNLYEVSIPGASYNPGLNFTSVFFTQPGVYTHTFFGRAPSAVDIYFTAFNVNARLDTIFFHAIPMTEQSRAQLVYNTHESPPVTVLLLQVDDNSPIQEIPPTAILGPAESQDITPPQTTISLDGDEVSISAVDNPGGSGVLYTYYTTDVQTFTVYQQPFRLPPDARTVMAFSIDRNGNREYPGAVLPVLGVDPTNIVFTAKVEDREVPQQNVQVLNLDPIKVTGQLTWGASTNVPWLLIEPQQGKTPGQITLAVDISNLETGTYTDNVLVRSLTPSVVFAERLVIVTLNLTLG